MTFDTIAAPLAGGALIGAGAVLLMATLGRIAGISGIVAALLPPRAAVGEAWRLAFVVGLLLGPTTVLAIGGHVPQPGFQVGVGLTALAGLLVGFGTTLGNGCTSGHGVCGLSRLSPRSLVATLTFMATAAVVVFLVRHVAGGGPCPAC